MSFEADLKALDNAARGHLPELANVYGVISLQMGGLDSAFQGASGDPAICATNAAFGLAWTGLCNQFTKIVDNCQQNATKIGANLAYVVDTYAATETEIETQLKTLSDSLTQGLAKSPTTDPTLTAQ